MSNFQVNYLIFLILTLIGINSSILAVHPNYSNNWVEWGDIPADSTQEAERRIWVANESKQTKRIKIDILDRSGQVIRHFIEANMKPGYLNIYWDKKNDSGLWIEPGEYQYRITVTRKEKTGGLIASFDPNELMVNLFPEKKSEKGVINYDILTDSVSVTIGIYTWNGRSVMKSIVDSLHLRGSYQYQWTNSNKKRRTNYRLHLKAAGITHKVKISTRADEKK